MERVLTFMSLIPKGGIAQRLPEKLRVPADYDNNSAQSWGQGVFMAYKSDRFRITYGQDDLVQVTKIGVHYHWRSWSEEKLKDRNECGDVQASSSSKEQLW